MAYIYLEHYKLRKEILNIISELNEDERIKLPKEYKLDDLIFLKLKTIYNEDIKVPIWTGSFLRKLDLSEIDFSNVLWHSVIDQA